MKKFYLAILAMCFVFFAQAQLTGTKTIPGDYATLALAITDLNAQGVGAGGVTFNISAGYTETLTAKLSVTATGTAANPIVFQKTGAGANPLITAYTGTQTPAVATPDGMWSFEGSDYVTIDGIDLTDPNSTNPATMEYGYGFFKQSATNGAQNNTIKNCVITLSRNNNASGSGAMVEGSVGILFTNSIPSAATTALTVTDAAGSNSNNAVYSNTLQNLNYGIVFVGYAAATPFSLGDTGNNIGGATVGTGNTIINYGGATAATNPAAAIRVTNQWGVNISNNTINSNNGSGVNHPSTLRGIYAQSGTSASATIDNNTVTVNGGGTTSSLIGIENAIGGTAASNTINITNNKVQNSTYSTATSGSFTGIQSGASAATVNMNNNLVSGNTLAGTGDFNGIYNSSTPTNLFINNNQVLNNQKTGASGTMYLLRVGTSIATVSNNLVNNNSIPTTSGTSGSTIYGIYSLSSPTVENFLNNTISNLSIAGTSTSTSHAVNGISSNSISGSLKDFSGNTIFGLSVTTSGSGTTRGIQTTTGNTVTISKNKIYDLTAEGASGIVNGITIASGTAVTLFNNIIGDLKAPSASAANAVIGINSTSTSATTNIKLYYNTVYINASSTGTNFGTSALSVASSATATSAALELRNNIFINVSTPAGTGFTVAYRRSTTSLANYVSTSNNNLFYAGVPSSSRLIFYDGTNADETLIAFKARVTPRESNSISENPPFLSTTGSSPTFLHLNTTIATSIESGGLPITGITTDFDGDTRNGTTPDIGADEFTGTPLPLCNGTPVSGSITGASSVCTGSGTNLSLTGGPTDMGITYEWKTSATPGGPYTTIPGATTAVLSTGALTQAAYYVVVVSCSNSGLFSTTAEFAVAINALPVVSISPAAPSVCLGGNVALTASGASTYTWSPSTNLSGTTGATVTSTPTVTRTYTVTGTDVNGCVDTETVTVSVNPAVTATSSAASTSVCLNGSTQLNAVGASANYGVTAIPNSPIPTPGTGVTTLIENGAAVVPFTSGTADDGRWNSIAIPFTFKFYGADYTALNISTNGYATFGTLSTTQGFNVTLPNTSTPNNAIHLVTSDLDFRAPLAGTTNAAINYFVDGVAPNRKFVINFKEVRFFHVDSTTGPDANPGTASVQAILYEGTNVIEIHTTEISNTTVPKAQGLENSAGTFATVAPGRNNTTTWTGAPNAYRFAEPDYTYSWSPSALLNNANIANPVASNITSNTTFTVTVTDPVTGCFGTSSVTVNAGTALTVSAAASSAAICNGSGVTLSSTVTGGGLPYTYSWSDGTSVVNTTAGFTASPTANTTYTLTVTDNCGQVLTSSVTVNVVSPTITATAPATRCGYGTVTLGATGSAGTNLKWYTDATGGLPIATGATYTTPALNTTTTYYVSSNINSGGAYFTGRLAPAGTSATNLTNYGEVFTVTNGFILNSVDVVSTTGTSITIALYNAAGTTQLFTSGAVTVPTNSTTAIPLGWSIAPGTYRLMVIGMTGSFIRENSGLTYPITLTGLGQIDGFVSSLTGTVSTSSSYYFMYNWNVTPECSSPRMAVTATVTTPPAVTVAATGNAICNGQSTTLTATSANAGYTYSWTPGNLTGASVVVSPTLTTKYYLNASDASGGANNGCAVLDSITITVNALPQPVTITPASASLCANGAAVQLTATGGDLLSTAILGTGTTVNATNGYPAPYSMYYGGTKHQMLIRASELTALGLQAGDMIDVLKFNVQSVGSSFSGTLNAFQIDMGHTTNTVLTSSAFIGGLTTVYGPLAQAIPTTGLPQTVSHDLSTNFVWNGTDNVIVQTSYSNNISGATADNVQMQNSDPGFVSTNWYRADGVSAATILAAATPTSSGNARPNMQIVYSHASNITWSPSATLYTDAAATIPYTGQASSVVYAKPATTTIYTATATTVSNCTSNSTATVTVNAVTSITTQPVAQAACSGGNATFSVTADGANLTYQWKKDGTDIAGATSASYTITGVSATDAGNYSVVVSGTCGTATSNAVALTVSGGVVIGTQPLAQAVCAGANASFTVAATGSGTLTYQWKKDGNNISGATSDTYTITGVTATDAGNYSVEVTATCGSVTSNSVALTINAATVITTQPSVQNVCAGANATFSVVATGTGTVTYQWKKDGVDIASATNASYTITGVTAGDAGNYSVVVTGACGSVTSSAVALSLNAATIIGTQPLAQAVCTGANASFTVAATGAGTITYQWKKDGNDISGATSATYSITSVAAGDAGNYSVVVTGTCGSVTSAAVALTLNAATIINTQPAAQAVCAGANASFTVAATGAGTITYQWKKDGNDIAGATSATYSINGVVAGDAGNYAVVVTGTCGSVTSNAVALTLNAATVISTQPTAQTACSGANASFTVAATGQGTLTYQWKKGGTDIAGATSATLTINGVVPADAGNYSVVVTGACGSVTSNSVLLTVNPVTTITTQPQAVTTCLQQNATFTVVAAGAGTLTYQWKKDGTDIAGATSSSYTVSNIVAASAGNYNVVITGACGSVTSANASLTVSGPCTSIPVVEADISSAVMMPNVVNNATTLRVTAVRSAKIQWSVIDMNGKVVMSFNNQVIAGVNDFQLRLAHLAGGNYYLVGSTDKGKLATIRFIRL